MQTINDKFNRKPITITKEGLAHYTPSVGAKLVKKSWNSDFWLEFNSDKEWVYKYLDSYKNKNNKNKEPGSSVLQCVAWDELTLKEQTLTWEDVVDKFYEGVDNRPAKDMLLEQLKALRIDAYIRDFSNDSGRIGLVKKGIHPSTIKAYLTRGNEYVEFKCDYLDKEFIYKEPVREAKEMWYLPTLNELTEWDELPMFTNFWSVDNTYVTQQDEGNPQSFKASKNDRHELVLVSSNSSKEFKMPKQYKLIEGLYTYAQANWALGVMNGTKTVANPSTQAEPKEPTMKPLLTKYGISRPSTEDMLDAINKWGKEFDLSPYQTVLTYTYFLTSLDFKERVESFNGLTAKGKEPFTTALRLAIKDSFNLRNKAFVDLKDLVSSVNTVEELEFAMRVLLYKTDTTHQVLARYWTTPEWLKLFHKDNCFPEELTSVNMRLENLDVLTKAPYFTKYFPKGNKRKRTEIQYKDSKDIKQVLLKELKKAVDVGESVYPIGHIDFIKEGL